MRRALYTLALYTLSPLFLLAGWKRCRKAKRLGLKQPLCLKSRFGAVPDHWRTGGIWIHAVSVGESRSIFPLLAALKSQYPHLPLTVTNGSVQGALQVQQFSPVPVQNSLIPYDFPFAMRRFLKRLQPELVIVVETELWPHLFDQCAKLHIPVLLLNARLKQASFQRYQRWGQPLVKESLQQLNFIGTQFPEDKQRLLSLGAPPERTQVIGNLKFDLQIPTHLPEAAQQLRAQLGSRFIWVAGSTHAGEEEKLLQAHEQLRQKIPDALLILVPRHADRFDEVAHLLKQSGVIFVRRGHQVLPQSETQVWLGDSVGELLYWYALADVAFIGGTLVPFGGHNILEPAALSKPVLSGPHYQNLASLYQSILACKGVEIVPDTQALAEKLQHYAVNTESRKAQGIQAYQCFKRHQGVLPKILSIIEQVMPNKSV